MIRLACVVLGLTSGWLVEESQVRPALVGSGATSSRRSGSDQAARQQTPRRQQRLHRVQMLEAPTRDETAQKRRGMRSLPRSLLGRAVR